MTTAIAIKLPSLPQSVSIGAEWIEQRQALLDQAEGIVVENDTGFQAASELLQAITKHSNALESVRKDLSRPFDQAAKVIKQTADKAREALEDAKAALKEKIAAYAEVQRKAFEARQAEERRKEQERAAALAQEREAAAELFGDDAAAEMTLAPEPLPAAVELRPATSGNVRIGSRVTFAVSNPDLVPRAFCMVDERIIRQYVNDHAAELKDKLAADPLYTFAQGITLKVETTVAGR